MRRTNLTRQTLSTTLAAASLGLLASAPANAQNGLPFRIEPPPGSVFFGGSVASGGDADGDGFDDVFVMDHDYEENGVVLGRSFMYSGRTGREMWRVSGAQALHFDLGLRYLVAEFIGDIDGDGGDDLILGQPNAETNSGRVEVYSGRTGALLYHYSGEPIAAKLGRDVAGVGDVDGDGLPDFAFVSRYLSDGRVAVHSGRDGSEILTLDRDWPRRIAGMGDVNDDGRDDVAVGGWTSPIGGLGITVFSGADGGVIHNLIRPHLGDSLFGWTLAGGHDLTGDGVGDLLASGAHQGGLAPRAYVINGRTGETTPLTAPADFPRNGLFAYAVNLADVNGDGSVDAIVTDTWADVVFETGSAGTVHYSKPSRLGRGGVFGTEVAVGDVNGDGFADIITQDFIDTGGVDARAGAPILLRPETPPFSRRKGAFDLIAHHGQAGRTVYFLAAARSARCTYIARFDLCLNLARPILRLGTAVTDADGFATLQVDASRAPTGSVWFQAVDPTDPQRGAVVSNVMEIEFRE